VVINARDESELGETQREIEAAGGRVRAVVGSMGDDVMPEKLAKAATEAFGRIDYVVNAVGVNRQYGSILNATREDFERTFRLNCWTAVAVVQSAIKHGMTRGGAVVNISTTGARRIHPPLAAYSASKAALDVVTGVLARELGPLGVRVNGVAPGLVETKMASVLWEGARGREEAEIVPLQRLGKPEDIAAAVCFLLSEDAAWITGVTLPVDGGRLLVGGESRDLIGVFDLSAELERLQ
jgi:3-oxoacyl-[acyl-carrier protein] reductase